MQTTIKKVIFISVLAMLFTAIINTNLGIIGQVASQNGNEWAGTLSVSLVFLASAVGSFVNSYIGRWSYRKVLLFGGTGWVIYVSFSVLFLFIGFSDSVIAVILIGSVICGLIVSMYYNGTNNYVNDCGNIDRCTNNYFGLNTCIIQTSNILGNSLSALLIVPLGQQNYSLIMLSLIFVVMISFCLIKDPAKKISMAESSIEEIPQNAEEKAKSFPLMLNWCFALSGVMISFVYSQFSIAFYKTFQEMDNEELNRLTFTTFIIEGIGEFLGGLSLFFFAKKIQSIGTAYILNGVLFLSAVSFIWIGFQQKQIWIISIGAFFVGLANCFCLSLALSIGGIWHEKGLSFFNFGQAFTSSVIVIFNIFFDLSILFFIYLLVVVLSSLVLFRYRSLLDQSRQNLFVK